MSSSGTENGGTVPDNPVLGILLMLCGMASLNSMDAISKVLTVEHSGFQVTWARYAFHLFPLLLFAGPARMKSMAKSRNPGPQVLRAVSFSISAVCIVIAFSRMPFADAIAVTFVAPLIMVALSSRFLGEHVGLQRWMAVLIGFAGMLLMVWPSGGVFDTGAVFALVAALFWAIGLMMTRLVRQDDPWTTLFYTALVGCLLLSLVAPFFWTAPTLTGWGLMIVMGLLGGLAHALIINAFRYASASLLAPFNYSMLIWATILGWLLFGQLPELRVTVGALIIILAGLYVWYRERQTAAAG